MLIFVKGPYLALIASGQKTTTIRPWKTCRLRRGSALWFNGRVRVTMTHVEQRRLGEVTAADARADGFATRADFQRTFRTYYPGATDDTIVTILHFSPPE